MAKITEWGTGALVRKSDGSEYINIQHTPAQSRCFLPRLVRKRLEGRNSRTIVRDALLEYFMYIAITIQEIRPLTPLSLILWREQEIKTPPPRPVQKVTNTNGLLL